MTLAYLWFLWQQSREGVLSISVPSSIFQLLVGDLEVFLGRLGHIVPLGQPLGHLTARHTKNPAEGGIQQASESDLSRASQMVLPERLFHMQWSLDVHKAEEGLVLHSSTRGAVADQNDAHEPAVYPSDGIKQNMLATQYPGKLRVVCSPAQWQGGKQTENFQALHLLEPKASTELKHPNLVDGICAPCNGQQPVKKKVDSYFYLFGQDSSYFGTPTYETSETQSVYANRFHMQGFSQKESYLNIDTGQQRQNLDFPADCLVVTAETTRSQDQRCHVPKGSPLLTALLQGDSAALSNASTNFSRERFSEGQKAMALNSGEMRPRSLDYSGAKTFAPSQRQISPPLCSRSSPVTFFQVGKLVPPTDEQIQNFVLEKIKHFRNNKDLNYGHTCSDLGGNDCRPNSISAVTSCSRADADLTPKTHEYRHVTGKAATNYVRSEDETPSITLDGLGQKYPSSSLKSTLPQKRPAETTPSEDQCCHVPQRTALLQEDSASLSNTSTNFLMERLSEGQEAMALNSGEMRPRSLDYSGAKTFGPSQQQISPPLCSRSSPVTFFQVGNKVPPTDEQIQNFVSEKIKHFRNKKNINNGHACSDPGGNDNSAVTFLATSISDEDAEWRLGREVGQALEEDVSRRSRADAELTPKTHEYRHVTGKAATNYVRTEDETPSITLDGLGQKYPSSSLKSSSLQEQFQSHEDDINKNLAFKDMTDLERGGLKPAGPVGLGAVRGMADVSHLQPKSYSVSSERQKFLKDPQYEDISDVEDITQRTTYHPLSVMQYEDISEDEAPQTGNMAGGPELFENVKYGSVPCGPSTLKDNDETDDDDWMVISLSASDLKFEPGDQEPEDEDGETPGEVVVIDDSDDDENGDQEPQLDTHQEPNRSAPPPSSQLEVFDTCESFLQTHRAIFNIPTLTLDCQTSESQTKGNSHILCVSPSDSESEETEDSCDYSSDSSHNHLTVSTKLLKKHSAMGDCLSEEDDGDDEAASEMVQHMTNSSKEADVIVIDSDTEDESGQFYCTNSDNIEDGRCSQPKSHSADLPAPRHQSYLHTAQSGQNGQKISENKSSSRSDSDMDDKSDMDCSRRLPPAGSEDNGDPPQKMHISKKVDSQHGSVKKLPRESGPSASSSTSHTRTEPQHTQHVKAKAKTKRLRKSEQGGKPSRKWSSGTEDSEDETVNSLCETAAKRKPRKQRRPSEDSQKNQARSVDKDTECRPDRLIPARYALKSSKPSEHLKLKDCRVDLQANVGTCPAKAPKGITKETDSGGKGIKVLRKQKPADHKHNLTRTVMHSNLKNCSSIRRQNSIPNPERPSTSTNTQSNIIGHFPEARQNPLSSRGPSQYRDTAATVRPSKSTQYTSVPRPQASSSKPQLYHSTSDGHRAPTYGLSALERVREDWQSGYTAIPPPRRHRRRSWGLEEDSRIPRGDSRTAARPRRRRHEQPPRQRSNPQESETPLMKRSKCDARQWTSAIHREPARKASSTVGNGYKWSEKKTEQSRRKGSAYSRRWEESILDQDL